MLKEFAEKLNGRFIGEEVSFEEIEFAKKNGIVIVFAHSDDCIEFRGAINDETYISHTNEINIGKFGVIPEWGSFDMYDERDVRNYFNNKDTMALKVSYTNDVEIEFENVVNNYTWVFTSTVPYVSFSIHDPYDDVPYCLGIVFELPEIETDTEKTYRMGYEAGYDRGYYHAQTMKRRGC